MGGSEVGGEGGAIGWGDQTCEAGMSSMQQDAKGISSDHSSWGRDHLRVFFKGCSLRHLTQACLSPQRYAALRASKALSQDSQGHSKTKNSSAASLGFALRIRTFSSNGCFRSRSCCSLCALLTSSPAYRRQCELMHTNIQHRQYTSYQDTRCSSHQTTLGIGNSLSKCKDILQQLMPLYAMVCCQDQLMAQSIAPVTNASNSRSNKCSSSNSPAHYWHIIGAMNSLTHPLIMQLQYRSIVFPGLFVSSWNPVWSSRSLIC